MHCLQNPRSPNGFSNHVMFGLLCISIVFEGEILLSKHLDVRLNSRDVYGKKLWAWYHVFLCSHVFLVTHNRFNYNKSRLVQATLRILDFLKASILFVMKKSIWDVEMILWNCRTLQLFGIAWPTCIKSSLKWSK